MQFYLSKVNELIAGLNNVAQIYQFLHRLLMCTLYSSDSFQKQQCIKCIKKAAITDIGWSNLFSCYKVSYRQIHNVKKKKVNAF